MKIFNILFAIIFLSFAAVQYNDPDPLLWIFIYGAMTIICSLAAFGRVYKTALLILAIGYFAYAMMLLPSAIIWFNSEDRSLLFDDIAKMQNLYIEETREFLGLIICLIVLSINYLLKMRQIKP